MSQALPASYRSILVIQTKFIGDIVLVSTLVRNLRLQYPGARMVFLCEARFESFLIAHGIADEVVTFRRGRMRGTPIERITELHRMVRRLRRLNLDLTIDVADTKTSRIVTGLVKAPVRVGYNPPERGGRWFMRQPANVFAKPFGFGGRHYLSRYLSPLEALGIEPRVTEPSIEPLPLETARALALLGKNRIRRKAFVAVHAGASFRGRQWQPERFAVAIDAIARKSGLDVVLIGGPDETEAAQRILAETETNVVDLVGTLSLETLLALLKQARMFLGNESGPMHMAASTGTPVVGLFGLTRPAQWSAVGAPAISVQAPMPCACIAPELCRWPDPSKSCCVWRLEVEPVVSAAMEILSRTDARAERAV